MESIDNLAGTMPPSPRVNVVMTAEIKQALAAYAAAHGLTVTDLLRDSALRAIGREDLIETMPAVGRPWPNPQSKPPKTTRKRRAK